jgi:nucleosome assembly protein 1-like 1
VQFLEKYTPLYDRRLAIISGEVEPTEEEIEAGQNADSDDEDEDDEEGGAKIEEVEDDKDAEKAVGVPEFWLTALRNHAAVSDTITDRDEEVSQLACSLPASTS